jgi:hypothetical protein
VVSTLIIATIFIIISKYLYINETKVNKLNIYIKGYKKITKGGKGKMDQNTFGQTKAARDLILHLEKEQVGKKTIKKISKKIANYNRGINVIIKIKDSKIKERLLNI